MTDDEEKPLGVMVTVFSVDVDEHEVLISGKEYAGDHYEKRLHLNVPEKVLNDLGWDSRTYLGGTVLGGKMVIQKDTERYKEEATAKRERIEADIADKARIILMMEQQIIMLKNEHEKLQKMLSE